MQPRSATPAGDRIRVAIIGATGYVGGELLRLLDRHPDVVVTGLWARDREAEPVGRAHPHLSTTGHLVHGALPEADAVFLALPHTASAALVPELVAAGRTVIDLGSDFRLKDPGDYPRWYRMTHPHPELLAQAVYGLPELHRAELAALRGTATRIVAAPGCYPTATILALAPLARAGLIGDLVVDAKSGVSGAGKEPKPELTFSEVNESVKAYGVGGHRHVAEMEQELSLLSPAGTNPGVRGIDFLPHLIPMTRGILSACHVRPTRPVSADELAALYRDAYAEEAFVHVVDAPPTTGNVMGSNHVRIHASVDERTGRILAIGVIDNLVKGAAGQGVQAFNVVHGLPETAGLEQLPLGFRAGAATAGIKASGKPDLSVVAAAHGPVPAAATFTTNRFASAPVLLSRAHLAETEPDGGGGYGMVAGLLSTSGCANAATGDAGLEDQRRLAEALAVSLGTAPERTLAVSTGLIGTRLPVEKVAPAIARLVADGLRADDAAFGDVAEALRTTDSHPKWATVRLTLPGPDGRAVPIIVSGVAKGVGMIHPRMATMLAYVLTDATIAADALHRMLRPIVARTWDQLSVDGDTSTSDTVFLLASGAAGSAPVTEGTAAWAALSGAVEAVARTLARLQAADGEGAHSLITCQVSGAVDDVEARALARAVVVSPLLKAAVHGRDPNWGRVAGALGNAQVADAAVLEAAGLSAPDAALRAGRRVDLDQARVRIAIAGTEVFAGTPLPFDKGAVSAAMDADEVLIRVAVGDGPGTGEAFGCDLSEEYVIENSEYST